MTNDEQYTVELSGSQLSSLLADCAIFRVDQRENGFDATAQASDRLTAAIREQVEAQGFPPLETDGDDGADADDDVAPEAAA